MPAAVKLRTDYAAFDLRRLAAGSRHANQSRRLLLLAAVLDGMDREQVVRIGGMDRQTLRDWVHRFNEGGPDGFKDIRSKGHPPRLSIDQLAALATGEALAAVAARNPAGADKAVSVAATRSRMRCPCRKVAAIVERPVRPPRLRGRPSCRSHWMGREAASSTWRSCPRAYSCVPNQRERH